MEHIMPFPELAVTHGGIFHADDVFACGFLMLINDRINVIRTADVERTKIDEARMFASLNYVVFDIGGGEFDHHTPETVEKRPARPMRDPHDEPYSSFGKIVRAYHDYLMSEDEYIRFDRRLCVPIDYTDCCGGLWGGAPNPLSDVVSMMNGGWYSDNSKQAQYDRFIEAAGFAKSVIARLIDHIKHESEAERITSDAIQESLRQGIRHFIELSHYVDFISTFRRPENESFAWAMYPSLRGGWQIYAVRVFGENRDILSPADMDWIKSNYGDSVTFIHPAGFTAGFNSRQVARDVCLHLDSTWDSRHTDHLEEAK